jgi:hypothetical protein
MASTHQSGPLAKELEIHVRFIIHVSHFNGNFFVFSLKQKIKFIGLKHKLVR